MTSSGASPQPGGSAVTPPGDLEFMTRDAGDEDLLAATAANHIDWMNRLARCSGGVAEADLGVHWTCVSRAATEVTAAVTQPPGPAVREQLDSLLTFSRARQADRIGYWAFAESYRHPLSGWLGARGFRLGGRPHWMAVDLRSVPELPPLAELSGQIGATVPDQFTPRPGSDLPCFHPDTAAVRAAMAAERPRRVWHAVQWEAGTPVGQQSLCFTSGPLGVCGLHDLVIVPGARVPGFGRARAQWDFRFALDLGCRYVVTNAAQEASGLYRILGFRSLGFGQTWWLPGDALRDPVPPEKVGFAEAIGDGAIESLETFTRRDPDAANRPLANRMSPLEFAAATGRQDSAQWLTAHGARPQVLPYWELGWRQDARDLLARNPELVNQRRPRSGKTLLHTAVERDDLDLVELLLAAGADTSARDDRFGGTPLDWAHEYRRLRIITAIKRASAGRPA
jgi:Ankyrin repeats (many copies)